jgi:hypothetical protein
MVEPVPETWFQGRLSHFSGRGRMKRYCIKCEPNRVEYFDILRESGEGFMVRLTRIKDGDEKISEVFLKTELFEMCLKTGYVYEMKEPATSVA